jgi:hypothetical protein
LSELAAKAKRYEGAAVRADEYKATCKQLQDELSAMRKQAFAHVASRNVASRNVASRNVASRNVASRSLHRARCFALVCIAHVCWCMLLMLASLPSCLAHVSCFPSYSLCRLLHAEHRPSSVLALLRLCRQRRHSGSLTRSPTKKCCARCAVQRSAALGRAAHRAVLQVACHRLHLAWVHVVCCAFCVLCGGASLVSATCWSASACCLPLRLCFRRDAVCATVQELADAKARLDRAEKALEHSAEMKANFGESERRLQVGCATWNDQRAT